MENRISAERKLKHLTQQELSERLQVDPSTVNRWENGGQIPQEKLLMMRGLFKCDIDWLICATNTRRTV